MSFYLPRNILVTGGCGFIGSNFIHQILADKQSNINIINYDLLTYAADLENLAQLANHERYQLVKGDICDQRMIGRTLEHYHIDTIVHFAAESHVDRSIMTPEVFVDTNVKGTYTLLESAKQYWKKNFSLSPLRCRFYHISTDEVFGSLSLQDSACTEHNKYLPNSPYSASKAAADHFVRAYLHTFELPTILSYCTNNFGKFQHTEKLIPKIIASCIDNKKIPIYGTGDNLRDWIYVEDHCNAIQTILTQGKIGEAYNIAGGNAYTNNEVAHIICEQMDFLMPKEHKNVSLIEYVGDRHGHDFRYALNDNKLKNELNWQPKVEFLTGIKRTIKFYMQKAREMHIKNLEMII